MNHNTKPKMVKILNSLSIDMVHIDKNSMVKNDEKSMMQGLFDNKSEDIEINYNYEISKYPITIAEYLHFVEDTKSHYPAWLEPENNYNIKTGNDSYYKKINLNRNAPIIGINWIDAQAYCRWLSKHTKNIFRLPSEHEWEFACRDIWFDYEGQNIDINQYAWYRSNSYDVGRNHVNYGIQPVGRKNPTPLGLYDTYGNVWEWCLDDWEGNKEKKTLRGGSWLSRTLGYSDTRTGNSIKTSDISIGFRIVREGEGQMNLGVNLEDEPADIENNYNILILENNLQHLNTITKSLESKGFSSSGIFPRKIESKKFTHDIYMLANSNNIEGLKRYIIQAIKKYNIHALIIEPKLGSEEINHPNDAIGSKIIAELEKMDEYKKLPIIVLTYISKYAMVDNSIVSDNILLAEKPYIMSVAEMDDVLDEDIIDDLNDAIIQYLEFQAEIKSSKELTLGSVKENLHDDIYQNLLEIINDEFKDYALDADYLPEGIDEVTITELYMPEELEFTKLIKNDDTYILDIKFEAEASVWMLVDKNHHDYISLKPLPVRDRNKQYYNAESEEILFIEMSIEFKIDKNGKIRDLLIDSIDDVVLLEDEHSNEREQDIKDKISDDITSILKTEHLKGLDYFQIHDESLPSDDHSALINSYDLPKKVEIENIEIFSNQFDTKIYLEQEVYLDIHILKNEYYSNGEYASLYGAVEKLNKHYVTVECNALISIELNIQGTRDKDIDSVDALDIDIVDISVIEQIPIDDKADFDSSGIHKTEEEFDKSFDTFYESVGINPNNASYFYDLGQTYLKVKSYDRAVEVFLKAIRLDSHNSTYYEQLGIVYLEINKYPQALESFRKALNINSDLVESWINMGVIYYNQSKYLKVIDVFTKMLKVNQKIHYKELARDIINSNLINEFIKSTILVNLSRLNLSQINELHKIIQQDLPIYIGQILSSSYAIIIQLSKEDKQNILNEIVWIDIRKYGIDKYLRNPNENETIKYDKDRFLNILENSEKKNWKFELRLNNSEPAKELGITYLTFKVFTSIKNHQEIQEIKNWFLDNYKKPNAFPIKFGEKDLQTFDDLKNTIFSQFETQYDTDIINHTIDEIKEEYGDIAWEKKSFLRVATKDGNIKHLDADSYREYVDSVVDEKQEKEKLLNKNRYLLCEIINLNTLYMLKIKLNENDKQKIFKGQLTIDIRDYYEIYNNLKSKANSNHNNNRSQYDKLIKKLEIKCWKIDLKIIEDNIGDSNIMYMSENIFEYTQKPSILDTISPIEKKLIQSIRDYDKYIYLTDFTKLLSQKLKIPRNKVIKILYRWRVFEKIDLAKESCISDLEINRNALAYILSLEI